MALNLRFSTAVLSTVTAAALSVAPSYASTFRVQPGDTLWRVAQSQHVTVSQLQTANPTVDPWNLQVGRLLQVPNHPVTAYARTTPVTWSNMYWLEHVINAEAGGESLQAQIAVGDVIMHRLQNGSYGSTVHDVVFQISGGHYQFTSVLNGYIYTTPDASSVQAAVDVLQKQEDIVPGALVFYNPAQTPSGSWVWSQPKITQYGNLVFAK